MRVVEIFDSIDGEGKYAGCLSTFIRLAGCNLRCSYCDTTFALGDNCVAKNTEIAAIVSKVKEFGNKHVTLTGGEPLIHPQVSELISALAAAGYCVNIETNGSVDISDYVRADCDNVFVTMDYKTPCSGMNSQMLLSNLPLLRECDVLKIVCVESDFVCVVDLLSSVNIKAEIYLSPVYGKIEPAKLVEFAKYFRDKKGIDVRVQVQLHKIIWHPDAKGV